MQRIEITIPDRMLKKIERHSDEPTGIETFVRRAIEQYVARLDKIDADAEYAKAHGHYPDEPAPFDEHRFRIPY